SINTYYLSIVDALQKAGYLSVPKIPVNSLKEFWSDELNRLKDISIDIHGLWKNLGSPRHGSINIARLKAKLNYKNAIRAAASNSLLKNSKLINESLTNKNGSSFWKLWNSKLNNNNKCSQTVDGCSDQTDCANVFRNHFSNTFVDSLGDSNAVKGFMDDIQEIQKNAEIFSLEISDVERCISKLKRNKSPGFDGLFV